MASGSAIRGVRVGSGPARQDEQCEPVPRRTVTYWCANGHRVEPLFAAEVTAPATWDCPHCGQAAGQDEQHPPGITRPAAYKTHLAYVKEQRSEAEAEQILAEALRNLRQRRGE